MTFLGVPGPGSSQKGHGSAAGAKLLKCAAPGAGANLLKFRAAPPYPNYPRVRGARLIRMDVHLGWIALGSRVHKSWLAKVYVSGFLGRPW